VADDEQPKQTARHDRDVSSRGAASDSAGVRGAELVVALALLSLPSSSPWDQEKARDQFRELNPENGAAVPARTAPAALHRVLRPGRAVPRDGGGRPRGGSGPSGGVAPSCRAAATRWRTRSCSAPGPSSTGSPSPPSSTGTPASPPSGSSGTHQSPDFIFKFFTPSSNCRHRFTLLLGVAETSYTKGARPRWTAARCSAPRISRPSRLPFSVPSLPWTQNSPPGLSLYCTQSSIYTVDYFYFFSTCYVVASARLEQMDKDDDSGATARTIFLRNDVLVVSHIGDSCLVPTFLST
jgi:hypothetical protein